MSEPTNSMYVETQALYNCAHVWSGTAVPSLGTAKNNAANGEGQGYLFGVLLASLQEPHDTFATASTEVLRSGGEVAADFGTALEQVAKDYESVDANVSTLVAKTEGEL